jgi:CRISPR/Cas system CSM-associated protein Csm3 (group 7 of RAMP superfamily)
MSTNKVVKRIAVRSDATLATPALIGSGEGNNSDVDIVRQADGAPFLPGSSLAGVLRSVLDNNDSKKLFGYTEQTSGSSNESRISPLYTHDAEFKNAKIVVLDGVALEDDEKTAKRGAKYDYEAVDSGARFKIRLLLVIREKDNGNDLEELLLTVLDGLFAGDVRFGGKGYRGFGQVGCESAEWFEINSVDEWANFDWDSNWNQPKTKRLRDCYKRKKSKLTADLKLDGTIMVRDFNNIKADEDYSHMSSNGVPVIFGTSWAGAIRHGLLNLLGTKSKPFLNEVFGKMETKNSKDVTTPSKVTIHASKLEGGGYFTATRVKIDRFTGGASDGALFTERPYAGGTTKLTIEYPKDDKAIEELFSLAIEAMDKGLLTIGGETAVGRGVFRLDPNGSGVKKEDGTQITFSEPRAELAKKMIREETGGTASGRD